MIENIEDARTIREVKSKKCGTLFATVAYPDPGVFCSDSDSV